MEDKPLNAQSSLGKVITQLKGSKGTCLTLLEGGVRISYYKKWISRCCGWKLEYEIIPKQRIVNCFIDAVSFCKCCPLNFCFAKCNKREAFVVFECLESSETLPNSSEDKEFDNSDDEADFEENHPERKTPASGVNSFKKIKFKWNLEEVEMHTDTI